MDNYFYKLCNSYSLYPSLILLPSMVFDVIELLV